MHEHLDGRMSIRYGPHLIAQYASDELPPRRPTARQAATADRQSGLNDKEGDLFLNWRLCLQTSGIYRFGPELLDREQVTACSRSPGPEPALELRPRRALSSAQVRQSLAELDTPATPDISLAN